MCSAIDTFSGFVYAMAVHVGRYQDFVCSTCRSGPPTDGRGRNLNEGNLWAADVMATQAFRFCECCQARLEPFEPHRLRGDFWVCARCTEAMSDTAEAVPLFARRRYLVLKCATDKALRAFDVAMEALLLDMEEIGASADDRARLEAERPARSRAVLERLEQIHGTAASNQKPPARKRKPSPRTSSGLRKRGGT
jgi:hypothetical protein